MFCQWHGTRLVVLLLWTLVSNTHKTYLHDIPCNCNIVESGVNINNIMFFTNKKKMKGDADKIFIWESYQVQIPVFNLLGISRRKKHAHSYWTYDDTMIVKKTGNYSSSVVKTSDSVDFWLKNLCIFLKFSSNHKTFSFLLRLISLLW